MTWRNQNQAILDLSGVPTPLSISVGIGSIPKPFGLGLVQPRKKFFLSQKFLSTPRNAPMGSTGSLQGQKWSKISDENWHKIQYIIKQWWKNATRIPEDFLGSKFMIPKIWGSAEISTVRAPFLKILSCQIFLKKNFGHFLLRFFSIFFQKLPKLSNFVRNMHFDVFRHHLINISQ